MKHITMNPALNGNSAYSVMSMVLPYSGILSREKTFANCEKYDFRGENFRGSLACATPMNATP